MYDSKLEDIMYQLEWLTTECFKYVVTYARFQRYPLDVLNDS